MSTHISLNSRAAELLDCTSDESAKLRIQRHDADAVRVFDFGVKADGGLAAGLRLAEVCMAGLGHVTLEPPQGNLALPQVFVHTDHPLQSCLQSQYAGWKIGTDDFFGMGSGPVRAIAGHESLFQRFPVEDPSDVAVGCLEAASLPTRSAVELIHQSLPQGCKLVLAVAPTASQAGNLQVVARSVETALHKLHELGFPVETIVSGSGVAPLPPVAKDDLTGIGRTNDAILYGATVHLHVRADDEVIEKFGPGTPSSSSSSYGESFLSLFKAADCDFYALDKALFSPAVVIFHSLVSGRSFRFGRHKLELVAESCGLAAS